MSHTQIVRNSLDEPQWYFQFSIVFFFPFLTAAAAAVNHALASCSKSIFVKETLNLTGPRQPPRPLGRSILGSLLRIKPSALQIMFKVMSNTICILRL
jgi:hypothetical protein